MTAAEQLTISVRDAAKLSGLGRDALYNLCHTVGFPAIWIGEKHVRIHRERFIQWVEEQTRLPPPTAT